MEKKKQIRACMWSQDRKKSGEGDVYPSLSFGCFTLLLFYYNK